MRDSRSIQSVRAFLTEFGQLGTELTDGSSAPIEETRTHVASDAETSEPIWARPMFDILSNESPPGEDIPMGSEDVPLPLPPEEILDEGPGWDLGIIESEPAPEPPDGFPNHLANVQDEIGGEWEKMQECFDRGGKVGAHVVGWNKGGLLVNLGNLQGFVPASQLVRFPRHLDALERESYLAKQEGSELDLKIIELDRERNRLVLSERACIWQNNKNEALLDILKSGDVVEGVVSNLCNFGAFVDLGGIDGLVHISEISWQRIGHPQDVLTMGQRVQVRVLSVDREQKRIALSMKRLREDPWATVEERYHVGQLVRGVITNVVNFGAFARIEDGLEGLIHISELAEGNFFHPRNVVQEGQEAELRILRIDGRNRRLGLSLRQAHTPSSNEEPESQP